MIFPACLDNPGAAVYGDFPMDAIREHLAVCAVAIVLLVWTTGAFDRILFHVGLNAQDCVKNAFGAIYCGDEIPK